MALDSYLPHSGRDLEEDLMDAFEDPCSDVDIRALAREHRWAPSTPAQDFGHLSEARMVAGYRCPLYWVIH